MLNTNVLHREGEMASTVSPRRKTAKRPRSNWPGSPLAALNITAGSTQAAMSIVINTEFATQFNKSFLTDWLWLRHPWLCWVWTQGRRASKKGHLHPSQSPFTGCYAIFISYWPPWQHFVVLWCPNIARYLGIALELSFSPMVETGDGQKETSSDEAEADLET